MFAVKEEATPRRAADDVSAGEPGDEGQRPAERRPEMKLEADERTPEEDGYGYGV
jgi:hypothetical protein